MAYQAITTGAISSAFSGYSAGFSFTIPSGITVNALGMFNATGNNFASNIFASLYDITTTPTLLATVTWTPQTSRVIIGSDHIAYQPVTPVALTTGKTYLIMGDGSTATDQFGKGTSTYSGDLTLVNTLYGTTGTVPTTSLGSTLQCASFLYGSYTLPINPGTLTLNSANSTTVSLSVGAGMFGTGTVTADVHRSTSPQYIPSNGTKILSAVTPGTVVATPADANLGYYKVAYTDTVPTTVYSNSLPAQTGKGPYVFGFIGDSRMKTSIAGTTVSYWPQIMVDILRSMAGPTVIADAVNQAVSGTYSYSWLSGTPLTTAISAFSSASVTDIVLDLGINDARLGTPTSNSSYKSNLTSIITSLAGGVGTLQRVWIPYSGYQPITNGIGTGPNASGESVNTALVGYQAQIDSLVGTTISGVSIKSGSKNPYAVLAQNANEAYFDGLHYGDCGNQLTAGAAAQTTGLGLGLISSGGGGSVIGRSSIIGAPIS